MKNLTFSLLNAGIAFGLCASAQAAVIYSDNFSGSGGTGLDGQAPTVRPGSDTWTAGSTIDANGNVTSAVGASAWLPYTFQSGYEYTITTTVDMVYSLGSVTIGGIALTSNDPLDSGAVNLETSGDYSVLQALRGGGWSFYEGEDNRTSNKTASGPNDTLFTSTQNAYEISMVVDTSGENWTVAGYFGGDQVDLNGGEPGMLFTYASNPSVTGIGINFGSSSQAFHSFELDATAIPEPSTYALLAGIVGIGALLVRRRKA